MTCHDWGNFSIKTFYVCALLWDYVVLSNFLLHALQCYDVRSADICNFEFFSGSKTAAGSAIHKTQWKVLPYRPGRIRGQQKNRKQGNKVHCNPTLNILCRGFVDINFSAFWFSQIGKTFWSTLLYKKEISSRWSNQAAKIILTAGSYGYVWKGLCLVTEVLLVELISGSCDLLSTKTRLQNQRPTLMNSRPNLNSPSASYFYFIYMY